MDHKGKTAIITGSSRGIGREIALALASSGANVVITGKTVEPHPKLEGTIYTVAEEARAFGNEVMVIPMDVRSDDSIREMTAIVVDKFKKIDILVNNASAIHISSTVDTPAKRLDLMFAVNVRATFFVFASLHSLSERIIKPSYFKPVATLNMNAKWFKNHVAYTISKYGMSMCTLGMAEELKPFGIAVNSLWPRTFIATAAIRNNFPPELLRACRVPAIVAKAAVGILAEKPTVTGHFFVDEDYLRSKGIEDFKEYAMDPGVPLQPDLFLEPT